MVSPPWPDEPGRLASLLPGSRREPRRQASRHPAAVLHLNALRLGPVADPGPFFILGQIATLVQDVDGFLHKWVRVQVPRDREAEARELLETMLQPDIGPPDAGGR